MHKHKLDANYVRSSIFGLEDALVSTTGVVVGITAAGVPKQYVLLASLVTVAVEAISMGAAEYLSEESIDELKAKSYTHPKLILGAVIMFVSYFLAGLVPILPVLFFPTHLIIFLSLSFALISLFVVGFVKGRVIHYHPIRSAMEMLVLGGIATLAGVIVGVLLKV